MAIPGAARGALTVAGRGTLKAWRAAVDRLELEQELAVLDRLGVLRDDPADDPFLIGLDLVHQLHRLEDAERLADRDRIALLDERRRAGRGGAVEGADHRRLDPKDAGVDGRFGRPGRAGQLLLDRWRWRRRDRRRNGVGRPAHGHAQAGVLDRHLTDAGLLDDADDLADPLRARRIHPAALQRVAPTSPADRLQQQLRVIAEERE